MTTEERDSFGKLANALGSWRVDTSGGKKNMWMHKWDIFFLTRNHLDTCVTCLEWCKSHQYAKGFRAKFQELSNDLQNFYKKLEQGELVEEEIFQEQIPLLESKAKQLAEHVLEVKYLCERDGAIKQQLTKSKKQKPKKKKRKRSITLTPRQQQVWMLIERGLTACQAAITMGCSVQNISKLLQKAKHKMNAYCSRSVNYSKVQKYPTDKRGQPII